MQEHNFDILIIGAGAAGMMAALELGNKAGTVAIVEALDRVGGRMHTFTTENFSQPVEAGAEFIHGNLELTIGLLNQAGIKIHELAGEFWEKEDGEFKQQQDFIEEFDTLEKKFKELKEDMPVSAFMEKFLTGERFANLRQSLTNYVQGYYAADINKAGAMALCKELTTADEEQYRVEGGYKGLYDFMKKKCLESGVEFFLSEEVNLITGKKGSVEFKTANHAFKARKILVTVPIGVLRSGIVFDPELNDQRKAIDTLGYGPVVKILLEFSEKFWEVKTFTGGKDLGKFSFLFSREKIPTWWSQYPQNLALLTGWSASVRAEEIADRTDEEIKNEALSSLANIFDTSTEILAAKLKAWKVFNWVKEPFSRGAYSYQVVGGKEAINTLRRPVEDTIYFAGEGLHDGPEIGTVEAALITGKEAAAKMLE